MRCAVQEEKNRLLDLFATTFLEPIYIVSNLKLAAKVQLHSIKIKHPFCILPMFNADKLGFFHHTAALFWWQSRSRSVLKCNKIGFFVSDFDENAIWCERMQKCSSTEPSVNSLPFLLFHCKLSGSQEKAVFK